VKTLLRAALCLSAALAAGNGIAQKDMLDLGADRPDFTEAATVVPRGSLQLELGGTWERGEDGANALSGPEALLRWGITDRLELRFELPEWVEAGADGLGALRSDAAFGTKLQIGPLAAWDVAAIAAVSIPTGDQEMTSDQPDPVLAVVASRDIGRGWSFGTQLVAAWPTFDEARELETVVTVVAGTDLGERVGTFIEVAATIPAHGGSAVVVHNGYTYQAGRTWQVDVHLGAGISESAPDYFVGTGLVARF
jgi:hypothetical protein